MDDAGTAAGGGAEAAGAATELVGVGVTEGEEVEAADVLDESVGEEVETPALPHPTARKAASTGAAIFEYLTFRQPADTPWRLGRLEALRSSASRPR